jgi:hypothetical protein
MRLIFKKAFFIQSFSVLNFLKKCSLFCAFLHKIQDRKTEWKMLFKKLKQVTEVNLIQLKGAVEKIISREDKILVVR